MEPLFGIGSPIQMVILAVIAFLLFGNRLPSVMRSVGRSVTEFKKGVAGIEDEIDDAVKTSGKKKSENKEDETEE
ncbi:MAG: twin-arginine translocase TatA/TatE family subunit [Thermoguttaceae bacterium]|nr:twin-arginine translocase TatA/TatE family subunit [Thermoguttaceae bacterium]